MKNNSKINLIKFSVLVFLIADLFLIYKGLEEDRYFTKTLLLPLLGVLYVVLSKIKKLKPNILFLLGLLFSFLGDFYLIKSSGFLFGLGAFFLAHVFYSVVFYQKKRETPSLLFHLSLLIYLLSLLNFLFPYLGEMKIPVIFYGLVLSIMLYFAVCTKNNLLILGAVLFVISDSLLSYNLFVDQSMFMGIGVMITYVFAQFFLVKGMVED